MCTPDHSVHSQESHSINVSIAKKIQFLAIRTCSWEYSTKLKTYCWKMTFLSFQDRVNTVYRWGEQKQNCLPVYQNFLMILHTKDYSTQFIYDSYSGNDRVAFFETWCTLHYDSIAAFLHAISEMQQQAIVDNCQFTYYSTCMVCPHWSDQW